MTFALVPVKRLEQSKSRLLTRLSDAARQALTLAMLEDLLEALQATRGLSRIAVTTPDPLVAERAGAAGAEILMRPEPGLNAALEDGLARMTESAADAADVSDASDAADAADADREDALIVLGDVAGAVAGDFERLLSAGAAGQAPGLWLAPSSDGGTSALLQRPARVLPCRFGPDSARRHREAAEAAGIPCHELALPSLAIDLDQPEDLAAFRRTRGGGRRTRALLVAEGVAGSDEQAAADADGERPA